MGISTPTIMIVASRGDDIRADVSGPDEDGKYIGLIVLYNPNSNYNHELVGGSLVDTRDEAIEMVQNVIDIIKNNVLPKDVKEMVEEIISTLEAKVEEILK